MQLDADTDAGAGAVADADAGAAPHMRTQPPPTKPSDNPESHLCWYIRLQEQYEAGTGPGMMLMRVHDLEIFERHRIRHEHEVQLMSWKEAAAKHRITEQQVAQVIGQVRHNP